MPSKISVGVWGVGGIGSCAVRELVRMPSMELTAVLVYSGEKDGVDVGRLVGGEDVGIRATRDVSQFLAQKPDCVLYAARDFGDFRGDADIMSLLEAGINVVTPLPYQFIDVRGADVVAKFDQAAKRGGATLFGTGINPGFMYERLAAQMTTLSHEIQTVRMRELFNCQHLQDAAQTLKIVGFGKSPQELASQPETAQFADNYLRQSVAYLGQALGLSLDRIERTTHHEFADRAIAVPGIFEIAAGTAKVISYEWTGFSNGSPRLSTRNVWYIHETIRPAEAVSDDCWIIEIEGRPSSRVVVDVQGSLEKGLARLPDNPTPTGFFGTVVACLQAIPHVVAAQPGIMPTAAPALHWSGRQPG